MNKVFVYGTLKNDRRPKDTIKGVSMGNCGAFPAIKIDNSENRVEVEVCEVTDEELAGWDSYEGCPSLYTRDKIVTENNIEGFIYQGNRAWEYAKNNLIPPSEDGIIRWTGRKRGE